MVNDLSMISYLYPIIGTYIISHIQLHAKIRVVGIVMQLDKFVVCEFMQYEYNIMYLYVYINVV